MKKCFLLLYLLLIGGVLFAQSRSIVFENDYEIPFDTSNGRIEGIDISRWQGCIDWKHIDSLRYKFCFIKATGGIDRVDHMFKYNWNNCHIPKGAYHFFYPHLNGTLQAKLFLRTVDFSKSELLPVIDVEYMKIYRRISPRLAVKNLNLFLDHIEKELGLRPIIYTNCIFWNKYIHPYFNNKESKYLLWIAAYNLVGPKIPKGWDDYTIWQWSHRETINNLNGFYDHNYIREDKLKCIRYYECK